VAGEISNHQFQIKTSTPNVKVSWQVTAVRQDAYAKAHPLVVEQQKDDRLQGATTFILSYTVQRVRSNSSGRTIPA